MGSVYTVGFDTFQLFCGTDSFIGYRFAAILVFSDVGLHVGEHTTWRELYEEHAAFIEEADPHTKVFKEIQLCLYQHSTLDFTN